MSGYSIETYTTKTNKVDLVDAAHMNAVQTSIVNIETALNLIITNQGSFISGTVFPTSPAPILGQAFYRTDIQVLYVWNGSSWTAAAIQNWVPNNIQVFTSTGTWTLPAGVTKVYVKVWGAGGGGGGSLSGTDGGASSFAGTTTIQGNGGNGGMHSGTGGTSSGGQINISGGNGGFKPSAVSVGGIPPMGIGSPDFTSNGVALTGLPPAMGYAYGGYGNSNNQAGGAGGYAEGFIAVTTNVTVTVGAAGTGGSGGNGGGGLVIVYY